MSASCFTVLSHVFSFPPRHFLKPWDCRVDWIDGYLDEVIQLSMQCINKPAKTSREKKTPERRDFTSCTNCHYLMFSFIISPLASFSYQCLLVIFHWRLNDSKSPQESRTLLSMQADLFKSGQNILIWIVSILPLTSNSSCPFSKP